MAGVAAERGGEERGGGEEGGGKEVRSVEGVEKVEEEGT